MKSKIFVTLYAIGAWLTFGHTSTLWGEPAPFAASSDVTWDAAASVLASIIWPFYWFCKTAMMAFS
jgi:hypothetical protein